MKTPHTANHRLVVRGVMPLTCDLCQSAQAFVVSFYHATISGPLLDSPYSGKKFNGPLFSGRACVSHVAEVTAITLKQAGLYEESAPVYVTIPNVDKIVGPEPKQDFNEFVPPGEGTVTVTEELKDDRQA